MLIFGPYQTDAPLAGPDAPRGRGVVGEKSTVGCRFPDVLSWRAACTLWARGIHLGGGASPSAGGVWRKVEMMCGDTARRGSSGWRWRWRPRRRWRWVADPFCSGDFFVSFE